MLLYQPMVCGCLQNRINFTKNSSIPTTFNVPFSPFCFFFKREVQLTWQIFGNPLMPSKPLNKIVGVFFKSISTLLYKCSFPSAFWDLFAANRPVRCIRGFGGYEDAMPVGPQFQISWKADKEVHFEGTWFSG